MARAAYFDDNATLGGEAEYLPPPSADSASLPARPAAKQASIMRSAASATISAKRNRSYSATAKTTPQWESTYSPAFDKIWKGEAFGIKLDAGGDVEDGGSDATAV